MQLRTEEREDVDGGIGQFILLPRIMDGHFEGKIIRQDRLAIQHGIFQIDFFLQTVGKLIPLRRQFLLGKRSGLGYLRRLNRRALCLRLLLLRGNIPKRSLHRRTCRAFRSRRRGSLRHRSRRCWRDIIRHLGRDDLCRSRLGCLNWLCGLLRSRYGFKNGFFFIRIARSTV